MPQDPTARRPLLKQRDEMYLRFIATVGERYGYVLAGNPDDRAPMPLPMMEGLGFTAAAAEIRKNARREAWWNREKGR